jgi:endonuclease/exonuclease/phosphatase family metal-dependent hydrolase
MWSLPKVTNHSTVMFWNIWGHRHPEALHKHITEHMSEVDIFCFTEVTRVNQYYDSVPVAYTSENENESPSQLNGVDQLINLMKGNYLTRYYSPVTRNLVCLRTKQNHRFVGFGSAMMHRFDLGVVASSNKLICKNKHGINPRVLQWIVYQKGVVRYLVAHLHGVWIAENTKGDHPVRLFQSREVREALQQLCAKYLVDRIVFGGDLNLALETQALTALLEGPGSTIDYRNLIGEYKIPDTRTPLYRKYGMAGESMHADYAIVSPKVEVHRFEVGNNVLASDHAPLLVEFS